MSRLGNERRSRRVQFRLRLEHLESRHLMAGLNVLVFADQDGSRAYSPGVELPASNRLVYLDTNTDGAFQDDEPFAVSGLNGIASFSDLTPGDYLVGLLGSAPGQVQTTAVQADSVAAVIQSTQATALVTSDDLKHAWLIGNNGIAKFIGASDTNGGSVDLGGELRSSVSATAGTGYALVEPTGSGGVLELRQLNLNDGTAVPVSINGMPQGFAAVGLLWAGDRLFLKMSDGDSSQLAVAEVNAGVATVSSQVIASSGKSFGSTHRKAFALVSDNQTQLTLVDLTGSNPSFTTLTSGVELSNNLIESASFAADGRHLFVSHVGGGVEVLSLGSSIASAAFLASARGPLASGLKDGRLVTGSVGQNDQLIVWDTRTWLPTDSVSLPKPNSSALALAVDAFGENLIAATGQDAVKASIAKPGLQLVHVVDNSTTQSSIGVRVVDNSPTLPTDIHLNLFTAEDSTLTFNVGQHNAITTISSSPMFFSAVTQPSLGTLITSPSGQIIYQPAPNANGTDTFSLRGLDGINSTTVIVNLTILSANDLPTDFVIDVVPVKESATEGAEAGFATVYDVDVPSDYLITTTDLRFYVSNGQLLRSGLGKLDFESEPSVPVTLVAIDKQHPEVSISRLVSVPILDANDGPNFIVVTATSIRETGGDYVGGISIEDVDNNGPYQFTLSDDRFEVRDQQLKLKDSVTLNAATEPWIYVTVSVADPTAELNTNPISTVVEVEVQGSTTPPPRILTVSALRVPTYQPGAVAGTVGIENSLPGQTYTYEVSDGRFTVENGSLQLKDDAQLLPADGSTLTLTITATDSEGNALTQTVDIEVINDSPFQNPRNSLDVDNDGDVYPRDVLVLINLLNTSGPHVIDPNAPVGEGSDQEHLFIDVNGDGSFSAIDILIIINYLNSSPTAGEGEGPSLAVNQPSKDTVASTSATEENDLVAPAISNSPSSPASSNWRFTSINLPINSQATFSNAAEGEDPNTFSTNDTAINWCVSPTDDPSAIDAELESLLDQLSRERLR